jgi:hypothetical protein
MRFSISGIDQKTGRSTTFVIDAENVENARAIAGQRGIQLSNLRLLDDSAGLHQQRVETAIDQCAQAMRVLGYGLGLLAGWTVIVVVFISALFPVATLLVLLLPAIFGVPAYLCFRYLAAVDRGEPGALYSCFVLSAAVTALFGLLTALNVVTIALGPQSGCAELLNLLFTFLVGAMSGLAMIYAHRAVKVTRP